MAGPDQYPENPHRISFYNEPLGIHTEIQIDSPSMEKLTGEDRALLEKLVATQSYAVGLLITMKGNLPNSSEWSELIVCILHDYGENIAEIEANISSESVASLLGVDLSVPQLPQFARNIHQLPSTGTDPN